MSPRKNSHNNHSPTSSSVVHRHRDLPIDESKTERVRADQLTDGDYIIWKNRPWQIERRARALSNWSFAVWDPLCPGRRGDAMFRGADLVMVPLVNIDPNWMMVDADEDGFVTLFHTDQNADMRADLTLDPDLVSVKRIRTALERGNTIQVTVTGLAGIEAITSCTVSE